MTTHEVTLPLRARLIINGEEGASSNGNQFARENPAKASETAPKPRPMPRIQSISAARIVAPVRKVAMFRRAAWPMGGDLTPRSPPVVEGISRTAE